MGMPVAKANVEACKRESLIFLWTHSPGWFDRRAIDQIGGRAMQIALQHLAREGKARVIRGPKNLFLYSAEMPPGRLEWSHGEPGERLAFIRCPHCDHAPSVVGHDFDKRVAHLLVEDPRESWHVEVVVERPSSQAAVGDEDVGIVRTLRVIGREEEDASGPQWIQCGNPACQLPFAIPEDVDDYEYR